MATLRGEGIRDIPFRKGQARNLRELFGSGGADPGNPEDLAQIKAVAEGYASGAYNDEQLNRFIEQNPATEVFLAPVIAKTRNRKADASRFFNPGRPAVTPFEGEFAGKGALLPQEEVPAKADYQGAILNALNKGDVESATALNKLVPEPDEGAKPTNQMTSVHLAVRSRGGLTGNPNIDALSSVEAKTILRDIQPFFSYESTDPEGGQRRVFGPRADFIPGGDRSNLQTVKSGQTQSEKAAFDQRGARAVIGQARNLVKDLWVAEGDVMSRAKQAAELKFKQFTQSDARVAQYNSLRAGFLAPLIRALGEKGTLAEGDISRAQQLWPTFTDSKQVAEAKLDQIEKIFDAVISGKTLEEAIATTRNIPKSSPRVIDFSALPKRK